MNNVSLNKGWNGCLKFGQVSNDGITFRNVGDEYFVGSVLEHNENGFLCSCTDIERYFKYYKFSYEFVESNAISNYDKRFIHIVCF